MRTQRSTSSSSGSCPWRITLSKKPAAPAEQLADVAVVDFDYVSTKVFHPSRPSSDPEKNARGITRNGLALMIERGDFPRPMKLGSGPKAAIRWRVRDIREWFDSRSVAA
jgi:predicted DNA-binding transcriptional regulator AlpA